MTEEALLFGQQRNLIGLLNKPEHSNAVGVIFLSPGLIGKYGMGRMHVEVARRAAASGFTCLRFDFSGVGDSPTRTDDLGVLDIAAQEPSEAIDLLAEQGCQKFVLVGLCSGAVAGLMAAQADSRVSGVVALNPPPLTTDESFEREGLRKRYLGRSLTSVRAWKNLLTGQVRFDRLLKAAGFKTKSRGAVGGDVAIDATGIVRELAERAVPLRFILSEFDKAATHTAMVLDALPIELRREGAVQKSVVAGAAHGFLMPSEAAQLSDLILEFLQEQNLQLT